MKIKDKLEIDVGDARRDYPYGDFLNAVDEIVCYFRSNRIGFDLEIASKNMVMYAENMEGD